VGSGDYEGVIYNLNNYLNDFYRFFQCSLPVGPTLLFILPLMLHSGESDSLTVKVEEATFPNAVMLDQEHVLTGPYKSHHPSPSDVIILYRGTEEKRIDSTRASRQFDLGELKYETRKVDKSKPASSIKPIWRKIKWDLPQLLEWAAWEKGLWLESGLEATHFYGDQGSVFMSPWYHKAARYSTELTWWTKPSWFMAGGSLIFDKVWGSLVDSIKSQNDVDFHRYGYSLTLGLPGLRYEFRTAGWAIPEYAFLEKEMPAVARRQSETQVLYQYRQGNLTRDFKSNKSHRFAFKLGVLRYSMLIDSDVYNHLVHELKLADIPTMFGSCSMGFIYAYTTMLPSLSFTLIPMEFPPIRIKDQDYIFTLSPLTTRFYYRNVQNFMIHLSFAVHLTDPLTSVYGDSK
jgi:hypothetical protein